MGFQQSVKTSKPQNIFTAGRLDGLNKSYTCEFSSFCHYEDFANSKAGTKVRLVKAIVFPVVMYGCESWTVKKAEH